MLPTQLTWWPFPCSEYHRQKPPEDPQETQHSVNCPTLVSWAGSTVWTTWLCQGLGLWNTCSHKCQAHLPIEIQYFLVYHFSSHSFWPEGQQLAWKLSPYCFSTPITLLCKLRFLNYLPWGFSLGAHRSDHQEHKNCRLSHYPPKIYYAFRHVVKRSLLLINHLIKVLGLQISFFLLSCAFFPCLLTSLYLNPCLV